LAGAHINTAVFCVALSIGFACNRQSRSKGRDLQVTSIDTGLRQNTGYLIGTPLRKLLRLSFMQRCVAFNCHRALILYCVASCFAKARHVIWRDL